MADPNQRADARRRTWQGGVAPAGGDLDVSFWAAASGESKLEAVWRMAVESLIIQGGHGPRSGLQGPAAGLRRR